MVLVDEGSGDEVLEDRLRSAVADRLGPHKKPHAVEFVTEPRRPGPVRRTVRRTERLRR
ncbi:hypothetical protein ACFQH8_14000 [Halomicroarcula sp. GCM10025710]